MTLVWRPGFQFDTDASNYIEAVEGPTGDNQALETATRYAINDFVIGCKQDGTWSAIKASCILAGARTLTGALVPLVGTAPTNFNFVSGDYNRKTGLVGNGSTKYLNSNRNNNADPQNSKHIAIFTQNSTNAQLGSGVGQGDSHLWASGGVNRLNSNSSSSVSAFTSPTFYGISRTNSLGYDVRVGNINYSQNDASASPRNANLLVFAASTSFYSSSRLAFYSIGESLNLALLDARVSALITAFGVAIP